MDLLLQVQADQLGVPVVRSAVAETTALGAALLAGLGAGWSSAAELAANWRADARVPPSTDPERLTAADAGHRMWRRAVTRSLAWADWRLKGAQGRCPPMPSMQTRPPGPPPRRARRRARR